MARYTNLDKYFQDKAADKVAEFSLSFSNIAEIHDYPLPKSARVHDAWWANHSLNPQASWIRSGYKASVDRSTEVATFRLGEVPPLAKSRSKPENGDKSLKESLDGLEALAKLDADWIRLVIESSIWVTRPAFDYVGRNNGVNVPGVFYPFTIRKQQTTKPGWQLFENQRRFVDLNHRPQAAISYALTGQGFQSGVTNFTCCHIYGGKYVRDWRSFTNLANIVLVPRPLQSLTDHHIGVVKELQAISYYLFDWKPSDAPAPSAPNSDLLELVTQTEICPSKFENIYQREIHKHRERYENFFNESPIF